MMLIQIFLHTPVWVWAMLAALLALGVSQCRDRRVPPWRLVLLPLALLGLGLSSMLAALVSLPLVALCWLLALGAGLWLGLQLPRPAQARWLADERRLHLPGSWLPLVLIVVIFGLRYSAGVSQALHPEWRAIVAVQAPLAAVFGVLSGLFLGRSLGLLALTRPTMRSHGHPHDPHRAG